MSLLVSVKHSFFIFIWQLWFMNKINISLTHILLLWILKIISWLKLLKALNIFTNASKNETMSKIISSMLHWAQHVVGIIYWINYLHLICQISTTPKSHPKPWKAWQWPEHMSFVIFVAHHIFKSNIGYKTRRNSITYIYSIKTLLFRWRLFLVHIILL